MYVDQYLVKFLKTLGFNSQDCRLVGNKPRNFENRDPLFITATNHAIFLNHISILQNIPVKVIKVVHYSLVGSQLLILNYSIFL